MEDSDRQKISSNLNDLSAVTNWSEDLESGLVTKDVLNLKMLQKIKVSFFYINLCKSSQDNRLGLFRIRILK